MKPSSANRTQTPSSGVPMYGISPGSNGSAAFVIPQVMDTGAAIAMTHPALQGGQQPAGQHAPSELGPRPSGFSDNTAPSPGPTVTTVNNSVPSPAVNPGVKPVAHSNPNSTQNMLQFAEIRDGIIIMNDGSFRSVLMVKAVNFDLMSQSEQEAVEFSFQGFLNSLNFPIQIFIRSEKVDLQPYIGKLDKIRAEQDNMLLAMLMEDYIGYMDQLGQQTNIMDKRFYVVVPFFPAIDVQKALTNSKNFITGFAALFDNKEKHVVINEADLEKAKTELRNRVQSVMSGLLQSGIQGLPLDTQELIELLYDTYNPDTATRQQIKNFDDLSADIVIKGEGNAPQQNQSGEPS